MNKLFLYTLVNECIVERAFGLISVKGGYYTVTKISWNTLFQNEKMDRHDKSEHENNVLYSFQEQEDLPNSNTIISFSQVFFCSPLQCT